MGELRRCFLTYIALPLIFLLASCVPPRQTTTMEVEKKDEISHAILHVGIEQKATGKVGKYGFKTYIYLSATPQVVGIDPRTELVEKYGEKRSSSYANSDYARFGILENRGRLLGKLILADETGDVLRGTFWDSYDVGNHLKRRGSGRYYLAGMARIDRKTYALVGIRCILELQTTQGKRMRSKEVYFLGRTESMEGYLLRDLRNVGLEIAFDVPEP